MIDLELLMIETTILVQEEAVQDSAITTNPEASTATDPPTTEVTLKMGDNHSLTASLKTDSSQKWQLKILNLSKKIFTLSTKILLRGAKKKIKLSWQRIRSRHSDTKCQEQYRALRKLVYPSTSLISY
jgi:hypothetical protein